MVTPIAVTQLLELFADSLVQLQRCVAPIPDARMTEQYSGLVNHPAWTLGHLVNANRFALQLLDEQPAHTLTLDRALYGPGSIPTPARSAYADKDALVHALAAAHEQLASAIAAKHDAYFAKPAPEAFRSFVPTVGRGVIYLIACHEPYHLGQLVQWKKAAGLA